MAVAVHVGGASGAFVSPDGLILTNHHVALGQLQKLSTPQRNYVRDGFYARSIAEELRCPDQEMSVLISTEDVSARVFRAVDRASPEVEQNKQRKAEIARRIRAGSVWIDQRLRARLGNFGRRRRGDHAHRQISGDDRKNHRAKNAAGDPEEFRSGLRAKGQRFLAIAVDIDPKAPDRVQSHHMLHSFSAA